MSRRGYRDRTLAAKLSKRIAELARENHYMIMHVCGT